VQIRGFGTGHVPDLNLPVSSVLSTSGIHTTVAISDTTGTTTNRESLNSSVSLSPLSHTSPGLLPYWFPSFSNSCPDNPSPPIRPPPAFTFFPLSPLVSPTEDFPTPLSMGIPSLGRNPQPIRLLPGWRGPSGTPGVSSAPQDPAFMEAGDALIAFSAGMGPVASPDRATGENERDSRRTDEGHVVETGGTPLWGFLLDVVCHVEHRK